MGIFLIILFSQLVVLAHLSPVAIPEEDPLATVSPILDGKNKSVVENVVSLIGKGYECSIAPLNSSDIDKDDLKVFCDSDQYTCYSCAKKTGEQYIEDQLEEEADTPMFSLVTRSMVSVLATIMEDGHICGVTNIQANGINIAGVKTLCETNFCFLCENRNILKFSKLENETNVLRITTTLFETLDMKTMSGYSCGITTKAIEEKYKVEDATVCDENVCLKCNKESPFDHIPEALKPNIVKVTKDITNNVKALISDDFSCGVTKQESTEIDSADLKIVCENKLCFLCKKPTDQIAAILDVETVAVTEEVIVAASEALEDQRKCAISFEKKSKFKVSGLEFFCSLGICFICETRLVLNDSFFEILDILLNRFILKNLN